MDTSPQSNVSSFIKEYGTLIIAIYGVIQLWLVYIFRLIFRRARVDLYTTELVEVGYSNFGPTIGLFGTITSLNKDSFISNVSLLLRRERDRAEHHFNWLAFRSNQITIGPAQQVVFELPSGFIVTPTQPHRYNILFSDHIQFSEMAPLIRQIEEIWGEQVRIALSSSPVPNYVTLFNTLSRSGRQEIISFHTNIQRLCYWERGNYSIQIRIRTAHQRRDFIFNRRFSLSEQDAERLRLNAISILAGLCWQPNISYNFAYPALHE